MLKGQRGRGVISEAGEEFIRKGQVEVESLGKVKKD